MNLKRGGRVKWSNCMIYIPEFSTTPEKCKNWWTPPLKLYFSGSIFSLKTSSGSYLQYNKYLLSVFNRGVHNFRLWGWRTEPAAAPATSATVFLLTSRSSVRHGLQEAQLKRLHSCNSFTSLDKYDLGRLNSTQKCISFLFHYSAV